MTKAGAWIPWIGLATCTVVTFLYLLRYSHNIPLAEDWTLIAAFTGHEPDFWAWLWSQNNEHRVPLPRLIMLGVLHISGGDFRWITMLNLGMLALMAALMMDSARRSRGGRSAWPDVFFPLLLAHIGHVNNMLFAWQFTFVMSISLVFMGLHAALRHSSLGMAIVLPLLPLCGATGMVFTPAFAAWLTYDAYAQWRKDRRLSKGGRIGLVSTGITALIIALYFLKYYHPHWNPPSPGYWASLKTAIKFSAMGIGSAAMRYMHGAVVFTVLILSSSLILLIRACRAAHGVERRQALFLLFFIANLALAALAIGHGRAGSVPYVGLPSRYVLLATPNFVAAYFIWLLYGPGRWKTWGPAALALLLALWLPLNVYREHKTWTNWYHSECLKVKSDIRQGLPLEALADRHRNFLVHWWEKERLVQHMTWLKEKESTYFARHAERE
jgi:hypothetical protein